MRDSYPSVSIIVPAYNAEDTIGSTLSSLINQTFANIEVIVIDDGSSDNTMEVVEQYCATDSRVYLIKKENGGAGAARNAGLEKASGDFITFVDSDDLLNQFAIQVMVSIATCANADVVVGRHERFDGGIHEPNLSVGVECEGLASTVKADMAIESILYKEEHEGVCGNLYRADLVNGLTFPSARVYEDACFNLSALAKAKTCVILHQSLYWYRQRNGSLTHTYSANFEQELLSGYQAVLADVLAHSSISVRALNYSLFCYASNLLWRIDSSSNSKDLWDMIKKARYSVFIDSRASAKYKVAAMCSLLGRRGYKSIGERALHIQRVK